MIKINDNLKTAYLEENDLELTRNEYNLLVFLMKNHDKLYSRGEIANEVWHKKLEGRTIDTTISRLRKKLGDYGKHIITRPGFGYAYIE